MLQKRAFIIGASFLFYTLRTLVEAQNLQS